ncbi:MAG: glycosyltransferase [Elusimicrobia bacterium]|nr:glycosyltransferase [Elusimicrobiota bacterium]
MLRDNDIICFGTADWDNPYRTNQHHVMERLAAENRVLFVESLGLRQPVMQKKDLLRIARRLIKGMMVLRKAGRNLYVFSPLVIPLYRYSAVRKLNSAILELMIKCITAALGMRNCLIWTYTPGISGLIRKIRRKLVVYHCVDELSSNPLIPSIMRKLEEDFIRDLCDVVFVTSSPLYRSKSQFSGNVHYLPNVADFNHFNKASAEGMAVPEDMSYVKRPVAGFVGAVSGYKLDKELIKYTARAMSSVSFVFIGPAGEGEKETDLSELMDIPNIHFLGPRPYEKLPEYLGSFDVCILPSRISEYTNNMFPMKFFEYLATGKPVVAVMIESLKEYERYFYSASSREKFAVRLEEALNEKNRVMREERIKFAAGNTWERRIAEFSEIIENARKQAV